MSEEHIGGVIDKVIEQTEEYYESIREEKEKVREMLREKNYEEIIDRLNLSISPDLDNINQYIKANALINALIFLSNVDDTEYENRYKYYTKLFEEKLPCRRKELEDKLRKQSFDKIKVFTFSFPGIETTILLQLSIIKEIMDIIVDACEEKIINERVKINFVHSFIERWCKEKKKKKGVEAEIERSKNKIETFIKRIILNRLQEMEVFVDKFHLPSKLDEIVRMLDKDKVKGEIGNNLVNEICNCLNRNKDSVMESFDEPISKLTIEAFDIVDIKKKLESGGISGEDFNIRDEDYNQWCLLILCLVSELKEELKGKEDSKRSLYIFLGTPHILKPLVPAFKMLKECLTKGKERKIEIVIYPMMTGDVRPGIVPMLEYTPMTYKYSSSREVLRNSFVIFHQNRGGSKRTGCYLAYLFEPVFELIEIVGNIDGPICPRCGKPTMIAKLKCEKCGKEHWLPFCIKCPSKFKFAVIETYQAEIFYLMFTLELFSKFDFLFMKAVYMFIQEYYEGENSLKKDSLDRRDNLLMRIRNAKDDRERGRIAKEIKDFIDIEADKWLNKMKEKKIGEYIRWLNSYTMM